MMGHNVLSALSFICTASNSVMIRLSRKRCLSVSTTHAIRMRDQGTKKVGSLKDFEVYDILKKELRSNRPKSYQSGQHGHLPEVYEEIPAW
jgi:hypothetical protein